MKIAIIAGGLAHERDVSIRSGRRVGHVLEEQGFQVLIHDLDAQLIADLQSFGPDVVWPLVHGSEGEDGSLQDLLSLLGFAFVGARGPAARIAHHKPSAKAVVSHLGLATPDSVTLSQDIFRELRAPRVLEAVSVSMGFPLVVKPSRGGSALGVTVVESAASLPDAMVTCFSYGDEALIEKYISGTDIAASVVDLGDGPEVLPLVEIVTEGRYDFDARYNPGRSEYFVPARLADDVTAGIREAVVRIHTQFGMRQLSRVDLIVDGEGKPWVIDVNVAPGMTETSLLPQAAGDRAAGIYAGIVQAARRG